MRCSILKRRPSAWVRSSMSVALLACSPSAGATVFPEGIEYNLEAEAIGRYESNPFRFSNNSPEQDRSSMVLHSAVRGGLVVPLLSERTRLEMSGTYGKTKYSRFRQLDHDPAHLDTAHLDLRTRLHDQSGAIGDQGDRHIVAERSGESGRAQPDHASDHREKCYGPA